MNPRCLVTVLAVLASVTLPAASPATPPSRTRPSAPASVRSIDYARRLDVNSLNVFVTNLGSVGYDLTGGGGGLYFPRGTPNYVLYASGLWIGGKVGGSPRVAIAEYSSEFAPGAMVGGTYDDPDRPEYAVWKVLAWSGDPQDTAHVDRTPDELAADPTLDPVAHHGWGEYLANAAPHGAPVRTWALPHPSGTGTVPMQGPAVLGDQMLWCVFNDANPALHTNGAGMTAPLGVEVRQSVFAYRGAGPAGQTAFIRWQVVNRGGLTIDSARVACWLDPDLGGYTDDLVGCDSLRSLGFAYNATNADLVYGSSPPALGVDLLDEAFDPSRGRTLGMTSFARYINGTDPSSAGQAWNVLRGLQANGAPEINPFTLQPSWYACPGDPVLGTGWLDSSPADRRMLLSRGPRTLAPGDSLDVWAAFIVARGEHRLASVQIMTCWDTWAQNVYAAGFPSPPPAAPDCGGNGVPLNCPRPLGFYASECMGGPHLTPGQLQSLAAGIDAQSRTFLWPPGPDGADTFCAVLNDATDVRAEAKGQYATLLANALAQPLGVVPAGTTPIALDLGAPVSIPGLAAATVAELIAPVGPEGLNADYQNLDPTHRTPIAGVNAGLGSFGGGAGYGIEFFGSTLDPLVAPDSFHTVRIRFDSSNPQKAYRFLRLEIEGTGAAPPQGRAYVYGGFRDVPFEAIDDLTGERVEAAFVERTVCDDAGTILGGAHQFATFDSTWAPDPTSLGGREYLFVLSRPYSGSPRAWIALDGSLVDGSLPELYALWAYRLSEADVFDDGDEFVFRHGPVLGPGADGRLFALEGRPLSDPQVALAYAQLRDGLAALNRGDGLATVCDDPTPALASLVSALADPGRVRVEWFVDAPGEVTVERATEPGGWSALGATSADGAGHVRWEDTSVEPGRRYGYRLALGAGGGAPYGGEAWVDVPREARLAIAGITPNPGGPEASLVFSLGSAERATIEMVDLAGRRVFAREVGAMGPGTHALPLGGRLAPGVYWLRLTQGERRVTARGVVVR